MSDMPTFKEIETELRRLAAEKPDYVYQTWYGSCFYNPTEREGEQYEACIFGQALANLGVVVPWESVRIDEVLERLGIPVFSLEAGWARKVQYHQDHGEEWSSAVAEADLWHSLI